MTVESCMLLSDACIFEVNLPAEPCGHAGIGPFSEVAFFHRPSRTLLVTDAVIFVPERPPEVVREASLLEAGGPLPASVRALSGGDAESPTEEVIAEGAEQQLLLGEGALLS